MTLSSSLPTTPAEIQQAVDAGDVTWAEVLGMLRNDLHMPEGAIEEWRSGDRGVSEVLIEWIQREVTG